MKVLIVDDSALIRRILTGLLKQLGYTDIVEAGDGHDALARVRADSPGLILLDVHMPDMDGAAVLAHLGADAATAAIPVIIISSDTDPGQTARMLELGGRGYITKPFKLEGLQQAIARIFADGSVPVE